jgi:glutamate-1-semialdehyde aminotransferase
LARLLTELAIENHFKGSIYSDDGIFKISFEQQKILTKTGSVKTVVEYNSSKLNRFISYINRNIFKLKPSSMCCGILRVKFEDEDFERLFAVYSRRSGQLGDFIQIDQFKNHL